MLLYQSLQRLDAIHPFVGQIPSSDNPLRRTLSHPTTRTIIVIALMITSQHYHQKSRLLLAIQIFKQIPNARIRTITYLYDVPN